MNAITSLYIPHVEKHFNAQYIADIFSRNGLAKVSKIYIEPYKFIMKNRLNVYNRAYVEIDCWHETESAYSLIKRLRNPTTEARLVHRDDNWWAIDINRYPEIFTSNNRVLTLFPKNVVVENDDCGSDEIVACDSVQIDAEKTTLLRNIVSKFKENQEKELMKREDIADFDSYSREIDWNNVDYSDWKFKSLLKEFGSDWDKFISKSSFIV